jgi:AcrR family transcriptional regulator
MIFNHDVAPPARRLAMPKSPLPRASKLPVKKTPAAAAAHVQREPRGERRKRETRSRLLEAALRLMAEKGMEGAAINEITEAADVGFGSFYNHFESKEAIYAALVDWAFEEFGDALDRLVRDLADPAEVISVCVRHTLLRARREPVWGQFLLREGFSAKVLARGLGRRLLRDIEKGVKAKRFPTDDILMMHTSVGGTVLASISVGLRQPAELKRLGFSADGLPERTAATLLRTLGLDQAEAEAIARRPLPSVEPELKPN